MTYEIKHDPRDEVYNVGYTRDGEFITIDRCFSRRQAETSKKIMDLEHRLAEAESGILLSSIVLVAVAVPVFTVLFTCIIVAIFKLF